MAPVDLPKIVVPSDSRLRILDRICEFYSTTDDFNKIIEVYETALGADELEIWERLRIWDRLGRVYETVGNVDEMVKVFEQAVRYIMTAEEWIPEQRKPTRNWPWDALGRAFNKKGKDELAVQVYEDGIKMGVNCWKNLLEVNESMVKRLKCIERVTEKWPEQSSQWQNLFSACDEIGSPDQIKFVSELLIWKHPVSASMWVSLGNRSCEKLEFAEAIAAYETAIRYKAPYVGTLYASNFTHRARRPFSAYGHIPNFPERLGGISSTGPLRIGSRSSSTQPFYTFRAFSDVPPDRLPAFLSGFPSAPQQFWQNIPPQMSPLSTARPYTWIDEPLPVTVLVRLRELYELMGKHDEYLKVSQRIVERNPFASSEWSMLLKRLKCKGDYEKSIETLKDIVAKKPTCTWPRILLGLAFEAKGAMHDAIKTYEDGIEQDLTVDWQDIIPQSDSSATPIWRTVSVTSKYMFLIGLGNVYQDQKDYSQAISSYQAAINIAPNESFLFSCLYFLSGSWSPSLFRILPGILIDETLPNALLWKRLGEAYKASGENDRAKKLYTQAVSKYRSAIQSSSQEDKRLVWVHETKGFREAISMVSPNEKWLWAMIGLAYKETGDVPSAIKAFEASIAAVPNSLANHSWLKKVIDELRSEQKT